MKAYADSSVLLAWFNPKDEHTQAVHKWMASRACDFFWNPALWFEVRHNLRKIPAASHRATAWNAYRAAEKWRARLIPHPFHIEVLLDAADRISASLPPGATAGSWDCLHVAAALRAEADVFLTCDEAQFDVAREASLRSEYLGG